MSNIFFIWNESYSVGINTIDEQHKKLIGIINRLYTSFMEKKQAEDISEIMKELADYTRYHFSNEERLFREKKYPLAAEHTKEHENFIDELYQLKTKFDSAPSVLTLKVMTFLQKWLKEHILINDKKYIPYLSN